MQDSHDDMLDTLLSEHFAAQLDGQLGKAEAAFRKTLTPARLRPEPARNRFVFNRISQWLPATAAVAAGITAVMGTLAAIRPVQTKSTVSTPQIAMVDPHSSRQSSVQQPSPVTSSPVASESDNASSSVSSDVVPEQATRTVEYRAVDQGTVITDDQGPMRKVLQQTIEHVEWSDPRTHEHRELDIPHEQVVLVAVPTY